MSSTLKAEYISPTNQSFTHTHTLSKPTTSSASDKSTYLADLRSKVSSLQEQMNKDLTARMEEDKVREAEKAGSGIQKSVDDEKEEANYGEEVQEEEEEV